MNIAYYSVLCLTMVHHANAAPITITELSNQNIPVTVELKVNLNNHNNTYNGSSGAQDCKCTPFFGEQLKECMLQLDAEDMQKNFRALSIKEQKKIFNTWFAAESCALANSFSEEEWYTWRKSLPEELQSQFPENRSDICLRARVIGIMEYLSLAAIAAYVWATSHPKQKSKDTSSTTISGLSVASYLPSKCSNCQHPLNLTIQKQRT